MPLTKSTIWTIISNADERFAFDGPGFSICEGVAGSMIPCSGYPAQTVNRVLGGHAYLLKL